MPNSADSKAKAFGRDSPIGSLSSFNRESRVTALLSNLRDFFVERPGKARPGEDVVFSSAGFGSGMSDNFKEFFKAGPRGAVNSALIPAWGTGFSGFWQNLREFVSPAKAARVPVGEPVPEIWSKNGQFSRVQALSVAIHVAALALIIGPLLMNAVPTGTTKPAAKLTSVDLSKYVFKPAVKPGGNMGGGNHDKTPPTRGQAPKFATLQFAAPTAHPILNPQIAMTPTLLSSQPVALPSIKASNWGDPLSGVLGDASLGAGGGNGIGPGNGNGFGNGAGDGPFAGYGGYGSPACIYCPDAQFSDEAVKEKHQGFVVVNALITADGRATDIKVIKSLGLGLDENAVAAVKSWRFKPALGPDGKPAAVEQTIQLEFRLI